jgi:branched-chain amino acid transport system ATP-binding protein
MNPGISALLQASDVHVAYGKVEAVRAVSLDVFENEIVTIIGANGAGKTTLLNAISGLVPMSGDLVVAGHRPKAVQPQILARLGLARSFQAPQLIEQENAIENVVCGAHLRSGYGSVDQIFRRQRVYRRERELAGEARELLSQVGLLSSEIEGPVAQLTHGTRKRIDIARALMARPKLLVMDEPTSGMGLEERHLVEEMVRSIRRHLGAAILMVEHHMDVVRAVADKAVAMQTGSVLMVGGVSDVLGSDEFVIASLGRAAAESLHHGKPGSHDGAQTGQTGSQDARPSGRRGLASRRGTGRGEGE